MAAIIWDDVVFGLPAPELAEVDTRAQALALAIVNGTRGPDPAMFGGETSELLKQMRMLKAAHMVCVGDVGVGGAVTSEREGELARTYASPDPTRPYQETSYGRLYYQQLRSSPARIGFTIGWC